MEACSKNQEGINGQEFLLWEKIEFTMTNGMVGQWTEGFEESCGQDRTETSLEEDLSLQGAKSRRDKNNQALFTLSRHLLGMSINNEES